MIPITPFGESALVIPCGLSARATAAETTARVRSIADAVQAARLPGVVDVVPSPDRVTITIDPLGLPSLEALAAAIARLVETLPDAPPTPGAVHVIPVQYGGDDGPDLDAVCAIHGIDPETLVRLHAAGDYLVTAIGFVPGFAYLAGLPDTLITPRRETPRTHVPAGSVGLGGNQTGIYPFTTPGGWHIIGRSAIGLFDPSRMPPSLLQVGDRVRFIPTPGGTAAQPHRLPESAAATATPRDEQALRADAHDTPVACPASHLRSFTVIAPGLHTTVQDLGRPGYRAAGVPLSGAADPVALRLANLAVGNPEDAAALECTLVGPTLRFGCDATIALAGAEFTGMPRGRPVQVARGTVLDLGAARRGCRGYLAIAGGIAVPTCLGSRSTYPPASLGGLHGRPVQAGDTLPLGIPTRRPIGDDWSLAPQLLPQPAATTVLRVVAADEAARFGAAAWEATFRTTARSDRMGLRLAGPPLAGSGAGLSVAVLPGTVQVPPDGQPIILLADAQTIGGYPILGQVIAADLPLAAQLRPGDAVRFSPVGRAEASAALRGRERRLAVCRFAVRHRTAALPVIDLNGDVGEGSGHDTAFLPLVSSANIACGGHAGDANSMRDTVALALRHGVGIGAHPGHADREGFGRRPLPVTPAEAAALVADQIAALAAIAGPALRHVKLHGALYHQVAHDPALATAVARRLAASWPRLLVVAPTGSRFAALARSHGLAVAEEGFADRGYADDGTLLPRSLPGAVLTPEAAAAQAVEIACHGRVRTASGGTRAVSADTLCVHGDGPDPVGCLRAVRSALAAAGVVVAGRAALPRPVAESGRGV